MPSLREDIPALRMTTLTRLPFIPKAADRSVRSTRILIGELLRGAEGDRTHHGFNPGCHLLGGDTVRGLKPAARGSENGPGCGGRQQCWIDTGCHSIGCHAIGCDPMKGKTFLKHILDDRDDGAFERHPSQLTGTACALRKIVADAEGNGV